MVIYILKIKVGLVDKYNKWRFNCHCYGGNTMVKITHAAIAAITKEIQDLMNEDNKPLIRLSMGIG